MKYISNDPVSLLNTKEECNLVITNLRNELKQYLLNNNLKSIVLGISGGIDSALIAAISKPICDELNIPIIGRSLTIKTNKVDEINRSMNIGKNFCTDFNHLDLSEDYDDIEYFDDIVDPIVDNTLNGKKIRLGNIKARLRMIYLYNLASKNKGMVMSTDNYTEYLLGFWTICGDQGDYAQIQMLWKTEVYKLSQYIVDNELEGKVKLALQECINAVPTDGLGISNSDLEQIGASSYQEADKILYDYIVNKEKSIYKDHLVINRHIKSEFKRHIPIIIERPVLFRNL